MDERYCILLEPGCSRAEFNRTQLYPDHTWPKHKQTDNVACKPSATRERWMAITRRRIRLFFFALCLIFVKLIWLGVLSEFVVDDSHMIPKWTWANTSANLSALLLKELHEKHYQPKSNYTFVIHDDVINTRTNEQAPNINCDALFKGDEQELFHAKQYMLRNTPDIITDNEYINMTRDCDYFRHSRGYILEPLSQEELDTPLAFSILMYKDTYQTEKLLRAIYMPQNHYCIHIDLKAPDSTHLAMRAITQCFPNVFIASRLESVFWGHVSILYAEMNCLSDLEQYSWKYFINLSGQMFPLHPNRDLVRILNLYDGANDIEGTKNRNGFLMKFRQITSWHLTKRGSMLMTFEFKGSPPHNITLYKGSNQGVMTRGFVLYLLHSPIAKDFLDWLRDTLVPDEYFYPSLNHNAHLHVPGAYKGDPETKAYTARATHWVDEANQMAWSWGPRECRGKWVRRICILGVGDLPWTYHRPELFVNKLFADYQWLTLNCLDQLIFNRTVIPNNVLSEDYYKNLEFVKHKDLVVQPQETIDFISHL